MKAVANREEDRTRAVIVSFLFHAAFLAVLIFWRLSGSLPPEETAMIIVPLEIEPPPPPPPPPPAGWAGGGGGGGNNEPDAGGTPTSPPPASPETAPVPEAPKTTPPKTPTTTAPDVAAIEKQRIEDEKRRRDIAAREEARLAEIERQRLLAEEAARTKAQRDKVKREGANAFNQKPGGGPGPGGGGGGGEGPGSGPGSGPGVGPGSSISGPLGNRKVTRPRMVDDTQKTGKVVISVCVDAAGNVTSAEYTMRGSTTNDGELRQKALTWAKQHKFERISAAQQCGDILFNFQVK